MIFDPYAAHKLTGQHAALFRESLGTMLDVFRESFYEGEGEPIWSFGVTLFDELNWKQQLYLLIGVSKCVLDGKGDPEAWTVLEKASFYAVYHNVYQQLEIERDLSSMDAASIERSFDIEGLDIPGLSDDDIGADDLDEELGNGSEDELSWKELITEAYRERCLVEDLTDEETEASLRFEAEEDESLRHWHALLDKLADQILDDRDFESASAFMGADPEIDSDIKKGLGIKPDDVIETVAEPSKNAVASMFQTLADLAGVQGTPDFTDDDEMPF